MPVPSRSSDQHLPRYRSTRLSFRRQVIDQLLPNEAFVVDVHPADGEPFTVSMTRRQFEHEFPNVLASRSWQEHGLYHYPTFPTRARAYVVADTTPDGGTAQEKTAMRSEGAAPRRGHATSGTGSSSSEAGIGGIRKFFQPYSIARRRTTTIRHAFASAIAPCDTATDEQIAAALDVLASALRGVRGEDSSRMLCVYCDAPAEDWDHLEALVVRRRMSGHGHTLGNLVPACKGCNSQKGNRPWREWVGSKPDGQARVAAIEEYIKYCRPTYRPHEELCRIAPEAMSRFESLQMQVLRLMEEADSVADEIRELCSPAPRMSPGRRGAH